MLVFAKRGTYFENKSSEWLQFNWMLRSLTFLEKKGYYASVVIITFIPFKRELDISITWNYVNAAVPRNVRLSPLWQWRCQSAKYFRRSVLWHHNMEAPVILIGLEVSLSWIHTLALILNLFLLIKTAALFGPDVSLRLYTPLDNKHIAEAVIYVTLSKLVLVFILALECFTPMEAPVLPIESAFECNVPLSNSTTFLNQTITNEIYADLLTADLLTNQKVVRLYFLLWALFTPRTTVSFQFSLPFQRAGVIEFLKNTNLTSINILFFFTKINFF